MSSQDEKYMRGALKLAQRGIGSVEPNPAVSAVIVKANRIIGKGRHKKFGGPHAEINALQNCRQSGISPAGATMYVTLEPCCHEGKTPPCTDAIISAGLAKVVVAAVDPSEHAGGKGIEKLRNAGIEVHTGLCETEARLLNAPFFKYAETGGCWVIVKWAQSIDGKMAWSSNTGKRWISADRSRKDAQKLRRRAQAVLVGISTVIADDPLLTARPGRGRQPTRVVLDSRLRIPLDCHLLATARKTPTLIAAGQEAINSKPDIVGHINKRGAEILPVPLKQERCDLSLLLDRLSKRGVAQLLVEGGAKVITSFLKERLVDEICIYIAPKILGRDGMKDISEPMAELTRSFGLHNLNVKRLGDDIRLTGLPGTKPALGTLEG